MWLQPALVLLSTRHLIGAVGEGLVHACLGFPALSDTVLVAIWVLATPGEGHTHVHPSRLSRKETLLSHLT